MAFELGWIILICITGGPALILCAIGFTILLRRGAFSRSKQKLSIDGHYDSPSPTASPILRDTKDKDRYVQPATADRHVESGRETPETRQMDYYQYQEPEHEGPLQNSRSMHHQYHQYHQYQMQSQSHYQDQYQPQHQPHQLPPQHQHQQHQQHRHHPQHHPQYQYQQQNPHQQHQQSFGRDPGRQGAPIPQRTSPPLMYMNDGGLRVPSASGRVRHGQEQGQPRQHPQQQYYQPSQPQQHYQEQYQQQYGQVHEGYYHAR